MTHHHFQRYNDLGQRWCSGHQAYHNTTEFGRDRSQLDQLSLNCRQINLKRTLKRQANPAVADRNRELARENQRRRRQDPIYRELCRAERQRRRARLLGAEGSYTAYEWLKLMQFYGGKCLCCGVVATTVDHVVPLVLGGSNRLENLQPLCLSCNSAKGARHSADYRLTRPTRTQMGAWRKTGLKQDQYAENRLKMLI